MRGRGLGGFRLRRLRAALPSSLVGLVTFSFVVLALGTAVYTASLPSLVEASPVAKQAGKAMGDAVGGGDDGNAGDSSEGASGAGHKGKSSGERKAASGKGGASGATGKLSSPGGLSAGSPALPKAKPVDKAAAKDATKDSPSSSEGKAGGKPSEDSSEDADAKDPANAGGDDPSTSDPGKKDGGSGNADDAQEEKARSYLEGQCQELESAVADVNALNSDMQASFLADPATREASYRRASAEYQSLWSSYGNALNGCPKTSRYADAHGKVVAMWRCLFQAVEVVQGAWTQNVAYGDASAHEAELVDIYNGAVSAEQKYLDEYNGYAGSLSL